MPSRKQKQTRRNTAKLAVTGSILAASLLGLKAAEMKKMSSEKRHKVYVQAVTESKVSVRNTNEWAKVSQVYKLNPTNAVDAAWIRHIETVSKKTKLSVPRVLLTIEQNQIEKSQISAINAKLKNVNNEISKLQLNKNAKGYTGRDARSRLPGLIEERSRLNRVNSVIFETLKGDSKVLKTKINQMRKTSGSKATMEKMNK